MEEKDGRFDQKEMDKITDRVLAYRPKRVKVKGKPPTPKPVVEKEGGPG